MSNKQKAAAIGGGVLVLAVGAFFLLKGGGIDNLPIIGKDDPITCPLTGLEPNDEAIVERPAVGLKIENAVVARPLSGLESADVVYEELVEGGETRFMAIFHCSDTKKGGPVRSARIVDPPLLSPFTKILGFSGANQPVLDALADADIVTLTETVAEDAMERVEREGISSEHTLYANSAKLRKAGADDYSEPPPSDMFKFGDLEGTPKKASTISLNFGGASTITYDYSDGSWNRSQDGVPFVSEAGGQISPVNVLVEEHIVNHSDTIVDSAGNPSVEIEDHTGSGTAVLFRNGRAITGTWTRESMDAPIRFETKSGELMVFAPGSVWIELVPSDVGEVKGAFSYEE
ncbi:MAG: DUF3048 domain-containing protein [Actinomycetota bacterium]